MGFVVLLITSLTPTMHSAQSTLTHVDTDKQIEVKERVAACISATGLVHTVRTSVGNTTQIGTGTQTHSKSVFTGKERE